MARNIEIKACIASVEALMARASGLADGPPERIEQDDTFFDVKSGRLKLRQFADGSAELIHYQREDGLQARASEYVRVPVPDAATLREALTRACGQHGHVRKQRWLYRVGATRIHLDRVEGLGDFIELEVVLQPGQDDEAGRRTAQALMRTLGLDQAPRVAVAYVDLLSSSAHNPGTGAN
jgi:predicted adenylyl cyclase CyaB